MLLSEIKELKKTPFSGVADLHGVLRTYLLSFLFTTIFFKINKAHCGQNFKKRKGFS